MARGRFLRALWPFALFLGLTSSGRAQVDFPSTLVFPTFEHTWGIRKATSAHLFLFLGWRTKFNDPQDLAAVRLKVWDDPATQDDDDELCVYGVNSGEANIIYNTSMHSVGLFGKEGADEGQFRRPRGIAADELGNVYVADTGNHRIVHLYNSGRELLWKDAIGHRGEDLGLFRSPTGVALDSRGHLWVTDTGNSRIQIFDPGGQFWRKIENDLCSPEAIALIDAADRWSYYGESYACVVDSGGHRLVKLSPQGELLGQARYRQTGMTRGRFGYMAIDYYGNVWLSDQENNCLHKFDRHLNFVVSFGTYGGGDREFSSPRGLAIWRRFGQVFVAEQTGAQYYWVGVDLLDLTVDHDPHNGEVDIRFLLTERAFLTIQILDAGGALVRTLITDGQVPIGMREYKWDGLGPKGEVLSAGEYRIRIVAEPTYSSYHYFQKVVEKKVRL